MKIQRFLLTIYGTALALSGPLYAATVTGIVLDTDKHAIAGAKVYLYDWRGKKTLQTQSGVDGSWTVEVPDADKPMALPEDKGVAKDNPYIGTAIVMAPGKGMGVSEVLKSKPSEIVLTAPTSIGGSVQNETGEPVAGVKLRIKVLTNGERGVAFQEDMGEAIEAFISTQSDAAGKWHFDGLAADAQVNLAVADDRFGETLIETKAGTLDAVVRALPGVTVKGRLLFPDGKPAPGFDVSLGEWGVGTKSDAEGRFSLPRLPEGMTTIEFSDPKDEWILPQLNVEGLTAGQSRDLGDLTLARSVTLKGQVIDETGKPISGVSVQISNDQTNTDETGHFSLRAAPGQTWISVYKSDFLSPTQATPQIQVDGAAVEQTIAPITLQRGVYLSGVALDAAGKPVAGAQLSTDLPYQSGGAPVSTGKDGSFRLGPLPPGKEVTLRTSGEWETVEDTLLKAPTLKEAASAPKLNITLRPAHLIRMTGRVVTPTGEPVSGVQFRFLIFQSLDHQMAEIQEVTSDAQGKISFDKLRSQQEPSFYSLESKNFALLGKPSIARDGDGWKTDDIIVSPLDGQLKGQIFDVAGKPAASAKVAVAGAYSPTIVETDANGRFSLARLPRGEITVLAAKDHAFAKLSAVTGQDVQLHLADRPTPSKDDGIQLLQKHVGGNSGYIIGVAVQYIDPEFIPTIIKRDASNHPDPNALAIAIGGMARRTPNNAVTWGIPQWANLPQDKRDFASGAMLAHAAIAHGNRDFAASWLQDERAKIARTDFSADAADKYFAMAGIAASLGNPDADELLDLGLTAADQSVTGRARDDKLGGWGRSVAFSPELLTRLTQELEPMERLQVWAGAAMALAPEDLPSAQTLLTKIVESSKTPEIQAINAKLQADQNTSHQWRPTSDDAVSGARVAVAVALGSLPGRGALDMIRQIGSEYQRTRTSLLVAKLYRDNGHNDEAAAVLRELPTSRGNTDVLFQAGGIALPFDKSLAAEMFDKGLQQMAGDQEVWRGEYRANIGSYSLYAASLDPAQARIRLEAEWAWRLAYKPVPEDNGAANDPSELRSDAIAMCALDLPRALEMLASIKTDANQTSFAIAEMGLYLATDGKFNALNPWQDNQY